MSKILIGSPVKQKSNILKEFLIGLDEADKGSNEVSYYFVDDNTELQSSELLKSFSQTHEVVLKKGVELFNISESGYEENDYHNHGWKTVNLAKVTEYKNRIIDYCIENKFDYLFLVDSDIVIDKSTIPQLLSDNVEIVSNIFWSPWSKDGKLVPQCFWMPDIYLQDKAFYVRRPFQESHKIRMDTYEQMKVPGLYKVKGLGACTMIKRSALEKGVNFTEIYNLEIPGEDRPFCIRAGAAGITLYMDTHYPAYHICMEEFLERVDEFKRDGFKFDMCQVFEEEEETKKPNFFTEFMVRVGKKLVRDFTR